MHCSNHFGPLGAALLAALALAAAAGAQAPAPAPVVAPASEGRTLTFQILLLVAETQGSTALEGIPVNAQKAIRDIQDFLPYKSYRLLDAAFLRTTRGGRAVMSGLAGQSYDTSLRVRAPAPGDGKRLWIDSFAVREVSFRPLERSVEVPEARVEAPTPQPPSEILATAFGMEVGETVVVGTSKLDGPNRALVVILSALP